MKISFIGYGNIVKAMVQGLKDNLDYQLYAASPSLLIGKNPEGVSTHSDNLAILENADIIILGVKPIHVAKILAQIKHNIPTDCTLISLAAGINLSTLTTDCAANQSIVRAMPNLPISVKKGATPLIANPYVSEQQKKAVTQLFQSVGITTWVTNEPDLDLFTALSGSGPAYVFLFLEAMINAAKALGLSEVLAKTFALQTVHGAIHMASANQTDIHELRQQVTSTGGTTAAAIAQLKEHGFEQILFDAIDAAYHRARAINEIM